MFPNAVIQCYSAEITIVAGAKPFAFAVIIISPAESADLTMASALPLNALRVAEGNGVKLVESPLSVATSLPAPLTEKSIC